MLFVGIYRFVAGDGKKAEQYASRNRSFLNPKASAKSLSQLTRCFRCTDDASQQASPADAPPVLAAETNAINASSDCQTNTHDQAVIRNE
jgi:hypothetical protein